MNRDDCEQRFGATNIASVETFRINGGTVDFGDHLHLAGAPLGDAVVCWLNDGRVAVLGKLFSDNLWNPQTATIEIRFRRTNGQLTNVTTRSITNQGGHAWRDIEKVSPTGQFREVRIRLKRFLPATGSSLLATRTFKRRPKTVEVTVHRHNSIAMTGAEADRILRDMGEALQNSDSPADVATQVQFVRDGPVRVLPETIPAIIQTQAQLDALFAAGTGVKVVDDIRWCGGPGATIIGCAPVGSPTVNIAVVPFADDQEGILWAHEYGHNAGNGHRQDDGRALMLDSIGPDHNVINSTESGRFLATGPLAITGAVNSMQTSCGHGEAAQPPDDVLEFVSRHWIEGVPREAASHYTEVDARRLLDWLVDEPDQHEQFLPEIVTTLCFIGSEVAVQPLIEFVESQRASKAVFKAKNAALIHLGDLHRKSGSQAAVDFLTRVATDIETARALSVPEVSRAAAAGKAAPTANGLGAELAVSATMGLSLAGTADARQTLNRLRSDSSAFASVNQVAAEIVDLSESEDGSHE